MVVASDNNMAGDMQFTLTHMFTADFSADDGTLYQCLAVNENGPNSDNVTLIVQGELYSSFSTLYDDIHFSMHIYMYVYVH